MHGLVAEDLLAVVARGAIPRLLAHRILFREGLLDNSQHHLLHTPSRTHSGHKNLSVGQLRTLRRHHMAGEVSGAVLVVGSLADFWAACCFVRSGLPATERILEVEDGVVLGYSIYSCLDCWDTLHIGFSP